MPNMQVEQTRSDVGVNSFIASVYNWMAIGLAVTGGVAYAVSSNVNLVRLIAGNFMVLMILFAAELGLVFYLSARVQKIQASTATFLFVLYAALNGATLSLLFLIYTSASITSTFFICAATFTACSIYGMVTKKDLTSMGGFMAMGLIGLIIASLVNMFFRSPMMHMIISYVGVLVFVGLTAYDTQKLKHMAISQPAGLEEGVVRKGAIIGALTLYLDFINMFIFLLRILGNRD
ncbi:MAG: Bax inhibitor-1/YccA family protein [Proteobacteria bacterium]|nr:Bax inhibitor-1/YccA family protein [Pseudomonadota bacterium]